MDALTVLPRGELNENLDPAYLMKSVRSVQGGPAPISRRGYLPTFTSALARLLPVLTDLQTVESLGLEHANRTCEMSFTLFDTALREQSIEQHLMYGPIEWCELQPRFETVGFLDGLISNETRHDLL